MTKFKDTRLIEALDYLDLEYIDDVIDILKVPPANEKAEPDRKNTILSVKLFFTIAASFLLISAIIPAVSYIIQYYLLSPGGIGGTTADESTEAYESGLIPELDETTAPKEDHDYSDIENLPALYRAVLKNEMIFHMKLRGLNQTMLISEAPISYYSQSTQFFYTALDMDGDGEIEVAVRDSSVYFDIIVFHIEGGKVYGFLCDDIEEIQSDGNYIWSDNSYMLHGFSRLSFPGGYEYEAIELCSKDIAINGTNFYVSGKPATKEEYDEVYNSLSKTEATWYPLEKYYPETSETHPEATEPPIEHEYDGSRGLEYSIDPDGKSATLVGIGSCKDRDVTVATRFDGKPVTVIGQSAFEDCRAVNSVMLPDSIREIGVYAFKGCDVLKSVNIPIGVTTIGEGAFAECKYLNSITLPESVTEIGNKAFSNCANLYEIKLPSRVDHFGSGVFEWCTSLTAVTLPEGIRALSYTFYACSALREVTLRYGITDIGMHTFNNCTALESITLPSSVDTIGYCAFAACRKLTDFNYNGVLSRWMSVEKDIHWMDYAAFTEVHCLDGDIKAVMAMNADGAIEALAEYLNIKSYNQGKDWLWVKGSPSNEFPKFKVAHSILTDGKYPVAAEYYVDIYTGEVSEVVYDFGDISGNMYDVITNKKTFTMDISGAELYLKDSYYPVIIDSIGYSGILKYAVIDMDGDGINEVIISNSLSSLILHDNGTSVRGYYTEILALYASGTFSYGKHPLEDVFTYKGIAKASFTEDGMTVNYLCYTETDKNDNVKYFIGGREVSAQEHFEFVESYSNYPADWLDLDYYPIYMMTPM